MGANYTNLDEERVDSEQPPTGNTYSDKFNFNIRYDRPSGRFWVEYRLRHNGSADTVIDPDEPVPPVGETLPAFTVHTLGAGVTLFQTSSMQHLLGVVLDNIAEALLERETLETGELDMILKGEELPPLTTSVTTLENDAEGSASKPNEPEPKTDFGGGKIPDPEPMPS